MRHEIVIPRMSSLMEDAVIEEIYVEDGDYVNVGDSLVQISADKVVMDLEAEIAGKVELVCEVGDEIEVGKPFCYIITD